MTRQAVSLRMRLTAIILLPLLVVATAVGLWQLGSARRTAADVFDRSLLSAALAVANDVAISGGDALSPRTRDILSDTSGGPVFYHVYAPDGVIVAGYATPPVGIPRTPDEIGGPTYFEAVYLGSTVSGVRLQNTMQVDGFSGIFTTTVWQDTAVRSAFVQELVTRSVAAICGLIASLALIVWFGVRHGLRPLVELESAIARRSSDELSSIQRAVPSEVLGIVQTLNHLFGQVSRSMTAQAEFISNAAHQLRNPIAGVLSLAEAVANAPSPEEARIRSKDLLCAARETAELSQKLLLLERAKSISPASAHETLRLDSALNSWIENYRETVPESVDLILDVADDLDPFTCDATMLREALRNLLDNAVRHGGPQLSRISVRCEQTGDSVLVSVSDDGTGIDADKLEAARQRFRQVTATSASGLGVSIVEAVVRGHLGTFEMTPMHPGLRAQMRFPTGGQKLRRVESRRNGRLP